MKFIFAPRPFILATIWPHVDTVPIDLVVFPLPVISRTINPFVQASSMLLATVEVSFVDASISKGLGANSLLHVVSPLTIVTLACFVNVAPVTVRFISFEESIKDVAIGMIESSFSFSFAVPPLSLVLCAIEPNLGALSMLQLGLAKDLSSVAAPIVSHWSVSYTHLRAHET